MVCRSCFQQSDAAHFSFVVLDMIENCEVTGIVTTSKDDVTAGRVVAETAHHFYVKVQPWLRDTVISNSPLILWSAFSLPGPTSIILNKDWFIVNFCANVRKS